MTSHPIPKFVTICSTFGYELREFLPRGGPIQVAANIMKFFTAAS
jgi:hypothetical protein